jgi:signal transduction histidine kinase
VRPRLPSLPLRAWMTVSHLAVLLLPVLAAVVSGALARELELQTRAQVTAQGRAIAHLSAEALAAGRPTGRDGGEPDALAALAPSIQAIEQASQSRVELIDPEGRVRVGSGPRNEPIDLLDRAEVAQALAGKHAYTVRRRPKGCEAAECRGLVRVFAAVPVVHQGEVVGAVRVSQAPARAAHSLWTVGWPLVVAVGLALLATIALSLASAHILSRSLRSLSRTSRRIRDGAFGAVGELARPRRSHVAEVGVLSRDIASMTERLQQRLGYISEFAGNVSHEFKTPITTLRGTIELLQDDPEMEPAQRERFLANALAELERLERLMSGLLALARAEEGGESQPVDLDAVAAEVLAGFPEVLREGRAGEVLGDPTQLAVALRNLVDNAREHGGPEVNVRLLLRREPDRAVITVQDDGPGISPANQLQVFDRFFTTGRGKGRTGLGLAMVRAIARSHGGEVTVTSQPGDTRFELWVPTAGA